MLVTAVWLLGAVAAGGLGLSCFYLLERPIRGVARVGSWVHGGLGFVGVLLLAIALPELPADPNGLGWVAGGGLGLGLLAGVVIWIMQRRRRPAGALVALHAALAVGGYVILLAFVATRGLAAS